MKTFSSFSPNDNGTWFWSWKFLILGLAPLNCRLLLLFRASRRISKGLFRSSGISGRRCGRLNLTILSLLGWSKYWSINTTSGTKPSWGSLFTGRSRGDECCWRTLWFPGLKRNKVCRLCDYWSQWSVTRSLPGAWCLSGHISPPPPGSPPPVFLSEILVINILFFKLNQIDDVISWPQEWSLKDETYA